MKQETSKTVDEQLIDQLLTKMIGRSDLAGSGSRAKIEISFNINELELLHMMCDRAGWQHLGLFAATARAKVMAGRKDLLVQLQADPADVAAAEDPEPEIQEIEVEPSQGGLF